MGENLNNGENLSPEEKQARVVERLEEELARRRETGELSPDDYDIELIKCARDYNTPVTRQDVGNHAIVIRPEEFEDLGSFEFVRADGGTTLLDFDDSDFDGRFPLIFFPEDFGDKETSE